MRKLHKFNAVRTEVDNHKFPSKLEANYYKKLKLLQQAGEVIGFFMQVPLHFKCGTTYRMDFLVFYADGTCKGVETKGILTPDFKIKAKMVEQEYPWFDLEIVKKV